MKVKGFAWAGVATDDFQRSLRFFHEVLGLPIELMGDELAILKVGPHQQLEIFGKDGPARRATASRRSPSRSRISMPRATSFSSRIRVDRDFPLELFEWQYFRSPDGHVFEDQEGAENRAEPTERQVVSRLADRGGRLDLPPNYIQCMSYIAGVRCGCRVRSAG